MMAPRVTTGFGSNVPGLHRPQYGNMVFPQAGTLPQRSKRANLGVYLPDGAVEDVGGPVDGEALEAEAAAAAAAGTDDDLVLTPAPPDPAVFTVNVTETVFPWELLLLGGALFFLMDSKKRRKSHGR